MNKNILVSGLKEIRVLQKQVYHTKEVKRLLKEFPNAELSNKYKKDIQKYWSQYGVKVSGKWHRFYYGCTGIEDARFIDNGLYYSRIIGRLNDHRMCYAYEDKNNSNRLFAQRVQLPKVIVRNISGRLYDENYNSFTFDEAVKKLLDVAVFIVKPSLESGGGKGIEVLYNDGTQQYINAVKNALKQNNVVIQKYISQNDSLAKFNPSSVNTIRVVSLLWKGRVVIIAKYLRVGGRNSDFVGCRTNQIEINEDGMVSRVLDIHRKFLDVSPYSEISKGMVIPGYKRIIDIVLNEHEKLKYFGLIGWDFTVDKTGEPVLIEINTRWPALDSPQMFVGPAFGELTDEIMEYVFNESGEKLSGVYLDI